MQIFTIEINWIKNFESQEKTVTFLDSRKPRVGNRLNYFPRPFWDVDGVEKNPFYSFDWNLPSIFLYDFMKFSCINNTHYAPIETYLQRRNFVTFGLITNCGTKLYTERHRLFTLDNFMLYWLTAKKIPSNPICPLQDSAFLVIHLLKKSSMI
jgi:hypothetical protein